MRLFFYGTLTDPDILPMVLGYAPRKAQLTAGKISGFRRKIANKGTYPVLLPAPAGHVIGQIFRPRSRRDVLRLNMYEGADYVLRRRLAAALPAGQRVPVLVYLPKPGLLRATLADWSPRHWRRHHKSAFLRELMKQDNAEVPCATS